MKYAKPERIWLKSHPELSEKWLQDRIGEDPGLLGLGELVLKDKERAQPRAGRLDLLFQDKETHKRYEVELQLGKTDEAHVIRTVEYWDLERRRYPQYDHTAVIVAEDITSRFLSVISLFNGFFPLVAIQLSALRLDDSISLVFTKVLDEMQLGLVDEDEEVRAVTDRNYWEETGTKATVAMADEMLDLVRTLDPALELKYNKFYIGLAHDGQPNNFAVFKPKKSWLSFEVRLPRSDDVEKDLADSGLDLMDYDSRWGRYRIRLAKGDIASHREFLTSLMARARKDDD